MAEIDTSKEAVAKRVKRLRSLAALGPTPDDSTQRYDTADLLEALAAKLAFTEGALAGAHEVLAEERANLGENEWRPIESAPRERRGKVTPLQSAFVSMLLGIWVANSFALAILIGMLIGRLTKRPSHPEDTP